jgi:hypothetical protein
MTTLEAKSATMSDDTFRKLQAMFQVMTENGLFDELAAYMHPEEINEVCDAVALAANLKSTT